MNLINFFSKKKSSISNNAESDIKLSKIYNERKKMFLKHMDLQYPKLSAAPSSIISAYKKVILDNTDKIIKEILVAESERQDREFKIFSEVFSLYIFVSILLKDKTETIKYYELISDEPGFGYAQFMTEHFLNNWPNNRLNHYLHIIILRDVKTGLFQLHNAAGDYVGNPNGKRTYMIFPVDILNNKEKEMIFNR